MRWNNGGFSGNLSVDGEFTMGMSDVNIASINSSNTLLLSDASVDVNLYFKTNLNLKDSASVNALSINNTDAIARRNNYRLLPKTDNGDISFMIKPNNTDANCEYFSVAKSGSNAAVAVFRANTTMTGTLSVTGNTSITGNISSTGNLTLSNGSLILNSNCYGTALPSSGNTAGRIFFQTVT